MLLGDYVEDFQQHEEAKRGGETPEELTGSGRMACFTGDFTTLSWLHGGNHMSASSAL